MSRAKVIMSRAGCAEVRNSAATQDEIRALGGAVAARAGSIGGGRYKADVRPGRTRAHCVVAPDGAPAEAGNARANALLKAMGGGGSR